MKPPTPPTPPLPLAPSPQEPQPQQRDRPVQRAKRQDPPQPLIAPWRPSSSSSTRPTPQKSLPSSLDQRSSTVQESKAPSTAATTLLLLHTQPSLPKLQQEQRQDLLRSSLLRLRNPSTRTVHGSSPLLLLPLQRRAEENSTSSIILQRRAGYSTLNQRPPIIIR